VQSLSHVAQAKPLLPQAALVVPGWQLVPSQQPPLQPVIPDPPPQLVVHRFVDVSQA
jgi:hypothetical protein